ncbi:MAG: Rab family GTPase [Promethearchaeia archaeon]
MGKKFIFKILTAGEGGVGKTTMLYRYLEGHFSSETKLTVGVEFFVKEIEIDEIECALQLWDFGGQDRFRFLLESYTLGAQGAFLMFDLTRFFTTKTLAEWIKILRTHNPDLPVLLVGTKNDLKDKISVDDDYCLKLKEELNCFDFIKISSKTGENVNELFEILVRKILSTKMVLI